MRSCENCLLGTQSPPKSVNFIQVYLSLQLIQFSTLFITASASLQTKQTGLPLTSTKNDRLSIFLEKHNIMHLLFFSCLPLWCLSGMTTAKLNVACMLHVHWLWPGQANLLYIHIYILLYIIYNIIFLILYLYIFLSFFYHRKMNCCVAFIFLSWGRRGDFELTDGPSAYGLEAGRSLPLL